jgi:hypothetical protein
MGPEPPEKTLDYRQEARTIRAMAWEAHDAEVRTQLLLIASLYDRLADLSQVLVPALEARLSNHSSAQEPTGGPDAV